MVIASSITERQKCVYSFHVCSNYQYRHRPSSTVRLKTTDIPYDNNIVDCRSDTVTRPSKAMREAMATAIVGDDVFEDDYTAKDLETRIAKIFNKEAALYFPTGTMCNLAAVMSWCGNRGAEMILGDKSHLFLYEQGGMAQIGGVVPRCVHIDKLTLVQLYPY